MNSSLFKLMDSLGGDIVDIQRRLDLRFIQDAKQFKSDFDQAIDKEAFKMLAVIPQRQVVTRHEVTARISIEVEKSSEKSLSVSLLNLSADLRYKRNNANDHTIKIEIEQVPLQSFYKHDK